MNGDDVPSGDKPILKHWRTLLFWALVVALAIWIRWWGSWNFALEQQICGGPEAPNDCDSYNIIFFSAWRLGRTLDHWSTLLAAIATIAVAGFTATIWSVNRSQLRHARLIERAYLWPGFGKHESTDDGMRWFITVTNTGQTAGVIQAINFAVATDEDYEAGGYKLERFTDREDVIPPATPNPGLQTGLHFVIQRPMICCGWIEYEDVFGRIRKRGWKHRLNLTPDSADNYSNPLPGCYSLNYKPWEEKRDSYASENERGADHQ